MASSKFPKLVADFLTKSDSQELFIDRENLEKELSLDEQCQIFLLAYETIVNHVEKFICENINFSKIVFAIGSTGFGSTSTTLALVDQSNQIQTLVGKPSKSTKTLIPNCFIKNNVIFIDFPAFCPTQGKIMWLVIETSLQFLVHKYNAFSILLINACICANNCRFKAADDLYSHLVRLFPNFQKRSIMAFTWYDQFIYYICAKSTKDPAVEKEYWKHIETDEQIWMSKFHHSTFLRFDDLKNTELIQNHFNFIKDFQILPNLETKPYKMPFEVQHLLYKRFFDLIMNVHEKVSSPFLPDENPKKLIPFILGGRCPPSIVMFFCHQMNDPSFCKELHNQFVDEVRAKFNSEVFGFLPRQLQYLINALKDDSQESLEKIVFPDVSIAKDTKLPQWVLKSVKLTDIFFNDAKIVNRYFKNLKIKE